MSYTTNVFSIPSKISQIIRFIGQSFFNTNPSVISRTASGEIHFPDVPSMVMTGWVNVTIRQKMGGSFADGVMYFSSRSPKTSIRSTKTFRVAVNFRDEARVDSERLLADQDDDITALLKIRGELNWINHKRGPNPILNVDRFQICEGNPQIDH